MIYYCFISSPAGELTAVCEDGFLTALHLLPVVLPREAVQREAPVLLRTRQWLDMYFRGNNPDIPIPMKPKGTQFQQTVWQMLTEIPYGKSVTYGELASKLGDPRLAQAVGQAVGKNPIPILVPCHRVLGAGRKLTGYAGGLNRKRLLLDMEKIDYR